MHTSRFRASGTGSGPARAASRSTPRRESLTEAETAPETRSVRDCKVVLFNDEEHTYDYVVEMLTHTCRLARMEAFRCAVEVDLTGRTIVFYGSRAACTNVADKIRAYGPDHRLPQSMTSMRAEVEEC